MKVSCIYPAFPTQTVPQNNQTLDENCSLIKLFQIVKANKMIKLECCHFETPNGSRHWGSKVANIKKKCEKQTCASWWNNKAPPVALPQGLHLTLITLLNPVANLQKIQRNLLNRTMITQAENPRLEILASHA